MFRGNGKFRIAFVEEVVGRTIIVHSKADDFTSQPAGNAGTKIACGKIKYSKYC